MNRQANIKHLPINLRKKAQRELRIRNGGFGKNRLKNAKRRQKLVKRKSNFDCKELEALIKSTEAKLKSLLEDEPLLFDIPGDVTLEELEGEIALLEGHCTTVYVEREGLSVLKILLPQEKPTIANLKRAIEIKAQIQLKRELREQHCPSNHHMNCQRHDTITTSTTATIRKTTNTDNEESDLKIYEIEQQQQQPQQRRRRFQQQPITGYTAAYRILDVSNSSNSNSNNNNNTNNSNNNKNNNKETDTTYNTAIQSTGELVCSATYNGHHHQHQHHCHQHRSNVSWRYLWRTYCLYNLNTKQPINDDDGCQLLSDCHIVNETSLKFCKREKYFGRKRQ